MTERQSNRRQLIASMLLALLGGLAGCIEQLDDSGAATSASSVATATPSVTADATPTESWTPPETPNHPTEDKRDGRITDVDFINTEEATNTDGYTDFDLQVGANTWMMDVDPPKDEEGEPYFVVEINDTLITRTDTVPFRKEGSFTISIKQAALQRFDAGTLDIRILFFDEDSHSDDLYGVWSGTIEYSSATTST